MAPGKWRPVYDSHTRGAKMAVSAIKKKIAAAPDAHSMMQIVLEHRDRFSDKNGQPLPFVQELSKYVENEQKKFTGEGKKVSPKEMDRLISDERLKEHGVDLKRYNGGTRERRLSRVKDDYINGDLLREDAAELYTRIYPKMGLEAAEKVIAGLWGDERRKQEVKRQRKEKPTKKATAKTHENAEQVEGKQKNEVVEPEQDGHEENEKNETEQSQEESAGTDPEGKQETPATGLFENKLYEKHKEFVKDRIKEERRRLSAAKSRYKKVKADIREAQSEGNLKPGEGRRLVMADVAASRNLKYHEDSLAKLLEEAKLLNIDTGEGKKDGTDNLKKVAELKERYGVEFHTDIIKRMSELDEKARPKAKESYLKLLESAAKADERGMQKIHENIEEVLKKGKKLLRRINNGEDPGSVLIIDTMAVMEAAGTAKRVLGAISEVAKKKPAANEEINEKSDFENIQDKYKNAAFEEGDADEIQAGKELISGTWKLVEADTPTASHDERSFHKTPGFPANDDGSTINDRDYGHDKDAQEMVMEIAADYDGLAVSVDNPVIVTKDGIVISGNNRTMSSKIAARKGTDKGYIEALKKRAKKFGFTPEQVEQFKHPRVIFETAENKGYSTDQFAKFNKSSKKAMSPIESAVKVSKTIKIDTVENIAGKMSDFETLGELYADRNAINEIFNTLQRDNIITSMDRPQYVVDGGITGAGKEFLETVLIGSVINESNIRGLNREGCKSIRQKLVRAITPLIDNKGMDGYSVTKELNEAVDIAIQVATQKDKFKSVDDYARQKNLFGIEDDPVSVEIARKLEGTQKEFAAFMQSMNGGLKYAANGEADIFLGNVESREEILARMLNLKKAISNVIDFFRNLRAGKGPRFIKKAVPVRAANGGIELSERWMQEYIEGIAPYVEDAGISDTGAKVVAVDFDGVINSYISGWKGPTETDEPVLSAAESLKTLYNRGYKVIIFSTRANTQEGIDTIREYLRKHTENNELADTIEVTGQKPIADMYIDDRAIPFNGDWEETLKRIEEFKPWTERRGSPISDEIIDLPDGIYEGLRAAYKIKLNNGVSFSTINGIRCSWNHPMECEVEISSGVPYEVMEKSLTYSGYPLQGRTKVQGMDISIENKKGSTRSGTDKDGHEWHTHMNYDYGYIRGTVGKDKDHVDCYIGPDQESEKVFVIHQVDPYKGGVFDEDKVMLGWEDAAEAKKAYLSQYDRSDFFGSMDVMDIKTFKEKVFDPANKGKMIKG